LVLLSVLLKVDFKTSVSFQQIQNFEVSSLAMAKVKKVNITVTYQMSTYQWVVGSSNPFKVTMH
jgi:hypothetical protein